MATAGIMSRPDAVTMSALPPRPGPLPRLEFAIPCRRFDNRDVSPAIEGVLEAAELRKPGRFRFELAVRLFAPAGRHQLAVTVINPRGEPEARDRATVEFTVQDPSHGERFAVPIDFPCEYVGWWTLEVALDGGKLGETHLWVQFAAASF